MTVSSSTPMPRLKNLWIPSSQLHITKLHICSSKSPSSLLTVLIMTPMESNDQKDWLRTSQSHIGSNSVSAPRAELETGLNTQAADPKVDEVQCSIVCDDCGKHFWSRSKADSHAALTAHVLHEGIISPSSPVIIPDSPAACSAYAPRTNTLFTSAKEAEASLNAETPDKEDSGDSGEEHSLCFDCGRHFWSHEAANYHVQKGHMQDTEIVPSSAPDGSPTFAATVPAVDSTSSAAKSSINPSSLYRKTGPGTASLANNGGITPTPPCWTTEQTTGRAIPPTSPFNNRGLDSTAMYGTTSPTSGRAMAVVRKQIARPPVPKVSQ